MSLIPPEPANSTVIFFRPVTHLKAALRNGSTVEILSLHYDGLISAGEILEAASQICYDCPSLGAVLVDQFLAHHDRHIAYFVGPTLQELTAGGEFANAPNALIKPLPAVTEGFRLE